MQQNHFHFVIEASGKKALADGMKSLGSRIGKAVNFYFGRSGPVQAGRFDSQVLSQPRQVRHALAYVLLNHRKHDAHALAGVDTFSSGAWFDGWVRGFDPLVPDRVREVAVPRSWLLNVGWKRYRPLVSPLEKPGRR